jgi:hypothetical protein
VEKINIEGNPVSDPPAIANQFNRFFTAVGRQISDRTVYYLCKKTRKIIWITVGLSQICLYKTPLLIIFRKL